MTPTIKLISQKKLIGQRIRMSMKENKTHELWRSFMSSRNGIRNKVGSELFSIQVYSPSYDFENFDPDAAFEKWAAVEVTDLDFVPLHMEPLILSSGLYSVFLHKGAANMGYKTFQYIFETWLPNSPYLLDQRPHFEILGEKYKNEDPASEEEVWIPIKPKV